MRNNKKRKMPKLLIIMADGRIDYVYSDFKVKYAIVDYDLKDTDSNPVLCVESPDVVGFEVRELYNPKVCASVPEKREFKRIYKRLAELGF